MWQAETISPAHEHFISYLIKQKILINTEKLQAFEPTKPERTFVLYLPENEIHELGLMYLNYEFLFNGYRTIYLGESVPLDNLLDVKKYFNNITYVCYTTVEPNRDEINTYVKELQEKVLNDHSQLWILGRMTEYINPKFKSNTIKMFDSIKSLSENL